ncbi:MAG TPA: type II and III secretion system protein [Syntrophales bacterium]|nr:type II and III secretion system protein [Syntrophales bacterium]
MGWILQGGGGSHNLYVTPGGGSAGDGTGKATFPATGFTGTGMGVFLPSFAGAAEGSPYGALGLSFGTLGGNIVEVQLNALQTEGVLNILSSPSITTLDNQKAYTENGERVPVVSTDNEGNRTVKYEDAVLRLEIRPHVIDGTNLKMGIIVKKDEVDTSRTVDNNPFIIKKQTETSLIVRDGETIVISGLTKQNTQKITTGIPGLKEVPLLGWLFKGEDKSDTMQEVLVFITPKILPPYVTAAAEGQNGDKKPAEKPERKPTVPGS